MGDGEVRQTPSNPIFVSPLRLKHALLPLCTALCPPPFKLFERICFPIVCLFALNVVCGIWKGVRSGHQLVRPLAHYGLWHLLQVSIGHRKLNTLNDGLGARNMASSA